MEGSSRQPLSLLARGRLLGPLLVPFLLSGFAALALAVYLEVSHRRAESRVTQAWESDARRAVGLIRSSQRLADRVDRMGFRLRQALTRAVARRGPAGWSVDLVRREAVRAFHPLIWQAVREGVVIERAPDGTWRPLPWPGAPPGRARLVAGVLADFVTLARGEDLPPARLNALKVRSVGLFGPIGEPMVLGRHQVGQLTTAFFGGARSEVLWDVIQLGGRPVGAYLFVFRRPGLARFQPLRRALDEVAVRFRGRHLPVLVPSRGEVSRRNLIRPRVRGTPADLLPLIRQIRRSAPEGRLERLPHERSLEAGGRRWFRSFLHEDRPWEIWIVSPARSDGLLTVYGRSLAVGVPFAATWLLVVLAVLVRGRPLPIPMRVSFGVLFLLMGGMPLAVFLVLGLARLETTLDTAIHQTRQAGEEALADLDGLGGQALRDFRAAGQALMARRSVRAALLEADPRAWAAVASLAFRLFPRFHSQLDRLQVFPVRSASAEFARPEGGAGEGPLAAAGLAASIKGFHDIFWLPPDDPWHEFVLSDAQKEMETTMRASFAQLSQVVYSCKFQGEALQISPRERFFRWVDILTVDGAPARYLLFRLNNRSLVERLLRRGAALTALARPADRFLVAELTSGGIRPLFPHASSSFWRSTEGRRWFQRLTDGATRDGGQEGRGDTTLWVTRRADRSGPFVLGAGLDLTPILEEHGRRRWWLFLMVGGLLALIGWVGGVVGDHLIRPLGGMQQALARVGEGDLDVRLGLARADELGHLAGQFDEMIRGLRQRRDLARFVSDSLEARVRERTGASGLEPRLEEGVVLVSDLRGFTTLAEAHPPEAIVALLNRHIEAMTGPIHAEGGRIEQFIGDAVVALFVDPLPGRAAMAAVRAARGMRRAHQALQVERRAAGEFPYEMGIGIDGGPLMVGALGGETRSEFAVIGPAREAAEGLESKSRDGTHSRILVAAHLWPHLASSFTSTPGPDPDCREIVLAESPPEGWT